MVCPRPLAWEEIFEAKNEFENNTLLNDLGVEGGGHAQSSHNCFQFRDLKTFFENPQALVAVA